jgi:enamine deaminase RidA (YjgF/YER057c/UK114 family)
MPERKSVYIAGFRHQNPIPNASRVGNLLMSGLIAGTEPGAEPGTQRVPDDLDQQLTNVFAHIRSIVEAAGGSTGDIVKLNVWLKDPVERELLNKHWLAMFPDQHARPARHTQPLEPGLPILVACEIVAVFDSATLSEETPR